MGGSHANTTDRPLARCRHRPRLHGHDAGLRRARSGRVHRHAAPGDRARRELDRHGRRVRRRQERGAGRPGAGRTARSGRAGEQVRQRAPFRRPPRRQRAARLRAKGLRCQPQAPSRRRDRSLLPAPGRPERADRGDGRRHGAAGRGGQGPLPRPLGGRRRHLAARAQGAPDRGPAERVLALEPGRRGRDPAGLPRARHRLRALQPARARFPFRARSRAWTRSPTTTGGASTRASSRPTSSATSGCSRPCDGSPKQGAARLRR